MPNTTATAVTNANHLITSGVVYIYGLKYEPVTQSKINTLAAMYPNIYTPAIKKLALAKIGRTGIDCSGFVCHSYGIPHINSTQLKARMTHLYKVSDPQNLQNGMLIWRSGHIGIVEIDDTGEAWILEAKGTAEDLVKTKYTTRSKAFTYYGELAGIDYSAAKKYEPASRPQSPAIIRELIDISHHNTINLTLAATKYKDIIIRVGYRSYSSGALTLDKKFLSHVNEALKNHMNLGFYIYDQSINETEARQQADWLCEQIRPFPASYPIFIDSEYSNPNKNGRADNITKEQRTKNIVAFCERIRELGCIPGVYASDNWFKTMLIFDRLKNYQIWCARYSAKPPTIDHYDIWQYGSSFIPGSAAPIDVNHLYKEYLTPSKPEETAWNEVTATALNVRDKPSTAGNIIGLKHQYDKVNIYSLQNNWAKISPTENKWCSYNYLRSHKGHVVNCSKLNCRNTPVSGDISFILSRNNTVNILRQDAVSRWYYIEFNGHTGYVSNKYISL